MNNMESRALSWDDKNFFLDFLSYRDGVACDYKMEPMAIDYDETYRICKLCLAIGVYHTYS